MIALKESILGKTKDRVRNVGTDVILGEMGFPTFEEALEDGDLWAWFCEDKMKKYESRLNKALKCGNNKYTGVCIDTIPCRYGEQGRPLTMIELVGMTHTGERGTWMNTEIFLQMIVPKITNREVYDFFRKFALNFDDMMEDIIEINKDEDYDTDAMFAVLNNKYKL